jgi:hypothetical protein
MYAKALKLEVGDALEEVKEMLEELQIGGSSEVDRDTCIVMMVDILYSYQYELRMLGFSDEGSSESSKNII